MITYNISSSRLSAHDDLFDPDGGDIAFVKQDLLVLPVQDEGLIVESHPRSLKTFPLHRQRNGYFLSADRVQHDILQVQRMSFHGDPPILLCKAGLRRYYEPKEQISNRIYLLKSKPGKKPVKTEFTKFPVFLAPMTA